MEKFFKVKESGSTVRTEVLAGLTTFMAMAYILMVNAGMFSDLLGGEGYNAVYIATAISAIIGTVVIGLLANLPLAQASGMGLNAFFVYTVCFGFGLSYANALVLVLFDGILFIILTITNLRKKIFEAIPDEVRVAIPAGIGLFIAMIGFQNAGIITQDASTGVTLGSFNLFSGAATWATVMPMVVTFLTLLIIGALTARKQKGAVLIGILVGAVIYYVLGFTVPGFYDGFGANFSFNPFTAFGDFAAISFGKVFTEGFDFSGYLAAGHTTTDLVILFITTALAFCLVDMFDTLGTLYGACHRGNLLDKEGNIPNMEKAMLADAIATCTGAICGTSTVTTFVESSAGVAEGGRTGLASMVTAGLFFIAMFLSPVASLIPGCATAAALIYVGILMINCVRNIEWTDTAQALPAFMTLAVMPFSYNISHGIAFGVLSSVLLKVFTGKVKDVKIGSWVIAVLFVIMFVFTH